LTSGHARLRVVGAACASCFTVVKKTLLKHDGILDVRANVAADLLLVDYEADKVSLEDILAVIRKAGYNALPIR
jgi:copper chaperone CopZ